MTGRPKLHALEDAIEKAGGDDQIFARVADGESLKSIMKSFDRARSEFYRWMDLRPGRRELFQEARKMSADVYAEESGEVLDELDGNVFLTAPMVQLATQRAGFRRWMAGVRDRATYGDKTAGVSVNLNIAALHLDALRQNGSAIAITGPVKDAELLPAGADEE